MSSPSAAGLARAGLRLVLLTLGYNLVEALVALWAGAGAGSIALLGFGLDSVIEAAASSLLLWRLSVESRGADPEEVEQAETRVHRFVGVTFIALSLYIVVEAGLTLWQRRAPEESTVGIALAAASLLVMPGLAWAKLRVAARLGSRALRAEAKETLACSYLSLTLLVGLVLNAAAGLWWADPVAALLMVPWLLREGMEGLRGDACCAD